MVCGVIVEIFFGAEQSLASSPARQRSLALQPILFAATCLADHHH
jgi:hypothetical protein